MKFRVRKAMVHSVTVRRVNLLLLFCAGDCTATGSFIQEQLYGIRHSYQYKSKVCDNCSSFAHLLYMYKYIYIYTCYPPCHCLAKRQHTLSSFSRESHHPARSGHQLPWPATRKKAMRGWLFHLALEASNRDVAAQSLFVGHSRPKASVVHISKKHLESPPVLFRFPKMNQATLDRTGRAPSKTLTSNRFEVRWVRFSAIIALSASSIPNRSQV